MDRRNETVPLRVQESLAWRFKPANALGYHLAQLDACPSPTLRVLWPADLDNLPHWHAPEGI
jgi:hypothetical protein